MSEIDRMIAEVQAQRLAFRQHAQRCAGVHDRHGYQIEAAACAIRERALLDAKRAMEKAL